MDGSVVVNSASSISHQGIRLTAVGTIMLQVRNPPTFPMVFLSQTFLIHSLNPDIFFMLHTFLSL